MRITLVQRVGLAGRSIWRAPWERDAGEPSSAVALRVVAAVAAVGLLLVAVGALLVVLGGYLGAQPLPLFADYLYQITDTNPADRATSARTQITFCAELLAGLALLHAHVALRLRRGGVGAYRSALVSGGVWLLAAPLTMLQVGQATWWPANVLWLSAGLTILPFQLLLAALPLDRPAMLGLLAGLTTLPALIALAVLLLPAPRRYFLGGAGPAPVPPGPGHAAAAVAAAPDEGSLGDTPPRADTPVLAGGPFATLSPAWRAWLLRQAQPQAHPVGAVVLREGDPDQDLYCLVDGSLEVVGGGLGGEPLSLAQLQPGALFGEMALLTGAPRTATIRAVTAARVLRLPADAVRQALAAHPTVATALQQRVDYLDVVGSLQRCSPFAGLPQPAVAALVPRFRGFHAPAGTTLLQAGEAGTAWYLIKRGTAEARWPNGRRLRLGPGDGFGEQVLRGAPSSHIVLATSDLELLVLAPADFQAVLATYPRVRRFFDQLLRVRYAEAPDQALGLPDPVTTLLPGLSRRGRGQYWAILLGGVLLLLALSMLTVLSHSGLVDLATALVGSFLAPAVYLRYLWERDLLRTLTWKRLAGISAFIMCLAVPAWLVECVVLGSTSGRLVPSLVVGVVEETAILFGVVWLLWRRPYRFELDGIVFGVAAAMAFAGIENMAYAFLSGDSGFDLSTVWARFPLTFIGHPVFTGLICAAIWRSKGTGGPRLDWQVIGAWGLSVLLHGLWDWSSLVFMIPVGLVGTLLLRRRIQQASEAQQQAVERLGLLQPIAVAGVLPEPGDASCPNCGLVPAPGTLYCARCGAALHPAGSRRERSAARRGGIVERWLGRSRRAPAAA
jgi:CRP-like cAMP-binding protein/RsiW-degrading membrane proteinase PrsW (M82 family)